MKFKSHDPALFYHAASAAHTQALEMFQKAGDRALESDVRALNSAVLMMTAQILDRLERIILLLDERLPAGRDLEGTVER